MVHMEEMEVDCLDFEAMDLSSNESSKGMKRKVSILEIYTSKIPKLDSRRASLSESMSLYQQSLEQKFSIAVSAVDVDASDLELVLSGHLRKAHWNHLHSEALLRLMKRWQDVLHNNASSDTYFTSLQKEDQTLLLHCSPGGQTSV